MPNMCPFLLVDADRSSGKIPDDCACIEERCAWWIRNPDTRGCAILILSAIAHDLALVRFPSLAGKKRRSFEAFLEDRNGEK